MEQTIEERIRELLLKARDLEQEAEGSRNEARQLLGQLLAPESRRGPAADTPPRGITPDGPPSSSARDRQTTFTASHS
jgi:hypothetical protein